MHILDLIMYLAILLIIIKITSDILYFDNEDIIITCIIYTMYYIF
jgi:hypothetical protein